MFETTELNVQNKRMQNLFRILFMMMTVLLIIPVFLPAMQGLGVDLIWFGILVIIVIELGLITPPIGLNVFTVNSVVPEIPLGSIFAGVLPYIAAMLVGLVLIFFIPDIALLLPDAMR